MPNKESIDQIIKEVFQLDSPSVEQSRKEQIRGFIDATINGDQAKTHLAINANLTKEKRGVLVYILTNVRLIKVDIDTQEVKSSSFPLDTMVGIERKLIDGDRASIQVSFQNGSFGLRYASNNQKISDFFQKVDLSRSQRMS